MSKHEEKVEGTPIKVRISDTDWMKMVTYCRIAKPNEIMGMARVREVADGLEVYNPFIMKQKVGPASCEFDRADFARFMATCEDIKDIKCIWHSHVNMSAFFSSCDRGTSEGMAALGRMMGGSSSWFLSVVLNLRQEWQAKLDIFKPSKLVIPCELFQYDSDPDTVTTEEVKQKLEEERSSTGSHDHQGFQGRWRGSAPSSHDLDMMMSEYSEAPYNGEIFSQSYLDKKRDIFESPDHEEIFDVIAEFEASKKAGGSNERPVEGS